MISTVSAEMAEHNTPEEVTKQIKQNAILGLVVGLLFDLYYWRVAVNFSNRPCGIKPMNWSENKVLGFC